MSKNPNQFNKLMRSARQDAGPCVMVMQSDDIAGALSSYLDILSAAIAEGRVPTVRYGTER